MHSFTFGNTTFNFNSDMSGDVLITDTRNSLNTLSVDGQALLNFAREIVRRERQTEWDDSPGTSHRTF